MRMELYDKLLALPIEIPGKSSSLGRDTGRELMLAGLFLFRDRVLGSHMPLFSHSRRVSQTNRGLFWGNILRHPDLCAFHWTISSPCVSILSLLATWKLILGHDFVFHPAIGRNTPSHFGKDLEKLV